MPAKPPVFLERFFHFIDVTLDENATDSTCADAAHESINALLDSFIGVLRAVPSGFTVRQLALQLLKQVPVKQYLEESKGDLADAIKKWSAKLEARRGHDLLDYGCESAAGVIEGARMRLSRRARLPIILARLMAPEPPPGTRVTRHWKNDVLDPPAPDGPQEQGIFRWQGAEHMFSSAQWQLLHALWGDEDVEEATLRKADTAGRQRSAKALAELQRRTNDLLCQYRIPFKIVRPKPLYLRLEHL